MKSPLSSLQLLRPRSLQEALELRRSESPITPIAGCTDVYVMLQFGQNGGARYLDLWALDELRGIHEDAGILRIGALATYSEIIASPAVNELLPILVQAARQIGGVQIQNRGTLAGNIANGSPAGDTLPVLAVAEATIVMRCADRERRIAFRQFYTGYRSSVLRQDELITAIEIPLLRGSQYFRKVGTRAAQAISKVVIAAVRAKTPRIALGSVAPTVVRLPRTETALANGASLADALDILDEEITPIDDLRSTAAYRQRVVRNLVTRWWRQSQ